MIWQFSYHTQYQPSTHIRPRTFCPWADMGGSGWYGVWYENCHIIISMYHVLSLFGIFQCMISYHCLGYFSVSSLIIWNISIWIFWCITSYHCLGYFSVSSLIIVWEPTFDERSARYKWNILERAVKPKSKIQCFIFFIILWATFISVYHFLLFSGIFQCIALCLGSLIVTKLSPYSECLCSLTALYV